MVFARKCAKEQDLENGFRLIKNDDRYGAQSVYHLHIHVMGGRQMSLFQNIGLVISNEFLWFISKYWPT